MFEEKCQEICKTVIELLDIDFEKISESEKEIIIAYFFGMINALAVDYDKDIIEVQRIMIDMLIKSFRFTEVSAFQFTQYLSNCTRRDFHPVLNAIIRHGTEGFFDYEDGNFQDIKDNINMFKDLTLNAGL